MALQLLYFAGLVDLLGLREETLVVPSGVDTVALLRAHLERERPRLAGRLGEVRFAVNETFARDDEALHDGDTVALIPPVSGG